MKKIISIFLCVIMILGMLPFCVSAAEDSNTHDELINLACEVFPEYRDIILGEPIATRSIENNVLISNETRKISDTETLGIARYINGYTVVYVTAVDVSLEPDETSSGIGPDIIGRVDFRATSNIDKDSYFALDGVGFIIHQNGTGYFTAYGTPDAQGDVSYSEEDVSTTHIEYNISMLSALMTLDLSFSSGRLLAELR